jgi:hypothetical protein
MKKLIYALIVLSVLVGTIACKDQGEDNDQNDFVDDMLTDPMYEGERIVSYIETDDQTGRTNIMVDGKPFLYVGAQIRTDALMNTDGLTVEELKPLFELAHELGLTSVQVPVEWKDVELEKDIFDFTYVDRVLRYANTYDLKIELLWFGTNMVGDSHSYTIPDYIIKDGKTYPKLDAKRTGEFWNYYGIMYYMDFNHPDLLEREGNALSEMMDFVYEWDRTHGAKHPLIGVQILNEADAFVRWRVNDFDVQSPEGGIMTEEEAWLKVMESLDHLGQVVKEADYKVYTRTNFANSTGADNTSSSNHGIFSGDEVKNPPFWAHDIFELDGIDIVGDDSYKSVVKDIKGISYMYGKNLSGNVSHIAENAGSYQNTPSLILTALSQGAGYSIYELATSPFFIRHGAATVDQGIAYFDQEMQLVKKEHFEATKILIEGLKDAWIDLLLADTRDLSAFNLTQNYPEQNKNQTITIRPAVLEFTTEEGALGFVVARLDHMVFFATERATYTLPELGMETITKGYYDDEGSWVSEGDVTLDGLSLEVEGGVLYRIDTDGLTYDQVSDAFMSIGS